jgi:acyl dehydratase
MEHETLLNKAPSLLSLYTRALLKRPYTLTRPDAIPPLVLHTTINQAQLSQYNKLCQITPQENILPPFFPQVLAFKLHLELLLNKQLPFPVMGLVHRDNDVEYFSPLYASDTLKIKVGLHEYKEVKKGINCTLITQVYVDEQLKWQATSTYFYRSSKPLVAKHKSTKNKKIIDKPSNLSIWFLNANLGRQYAKITGDLNPIHLYRLTAKLFGFKQTIIHGMCMAAKATAHAQSEHPSLPMRIYIEFNKPIYLPSKVAFIQTAQDFSICPILEQQVIDSPMLSGKLETNMRLRDSNAV